MSNATADSINSELTAANFDLEPKITELAHVAAIARSYVLENVSPRADETEDQRLEIDRVAASISHVADMADDLMKSYHAAIGSSRKART
jgi:hypothetical protein